MPLALKFAYSFLFVRPSLQNWRWYVKEKTLALNIILLPSLIIKRIKGFQSITTQDATLSDTKVQRSLSSPFFPLLLGGTWNTDVQRLFIWLWRLPALPMGIQVPNDLQERFKQLSVSCLKEIYIYSCKEDLVRKRRGRSLEPWLGRFITRKYEKEKPNSELTSILSGPRHNFSSFVQLDITILSCSWSSIFLHVLNCLNITYLYSIYAFQIDKHKKYMLSYLGSWFFFSLSNYHHYFYRTYSRNRIQLYV